MKKLIYASVFILTVATVRPQQSFAAFPVRPQEPAQTVVTYHNPTSLVSVPTMNTKEVNGSVPALPSPATGGKSQTTALILAIFLGWLGIHRFYLGYTWQGIVQLLTFGGFVVWWVVDVVRIISGDLQPKGGSYASTL